MAKKIIGNVSSRVVELLNLDIEPGTPIFIGESNIEHMKARHEYDYMRYGHLLQSILLEPDYVARGSNDSIEYVKRILVDNAYVKVAVRVSSKGTCFARTIYRLNDNRVNNFIKKGTLKKY